MTEPRQLVPTMGLSHDGFRFLEGLFERLEGYAVGRMTKSRRSKLYIDDAGWGPEAGSVEYGYRVPFGGIHVFIGKIRELSPEPDICTDLVETAQRARSARVKLAMKRAFVGVIHGGGHEDGLGSGDEPSFTPAMSHQPEKPNLYISYKMAGLGAVPMAKVFRTPLIYPTELEYSWLARKQHFILRLLRQ